MSLTRGELLAAAAAEGFQRAAIAAREDGGSSLVCALSCFRREPDDLSVPGDPHGTIAPFARRNFYGEAVFRLKRVARLVMERTGLGKADLRIFSNSTLPEKPLAAQAGLGFYGRNSLLIAPGLGSLFVIAGLRLPLAMEPDRAPEGWGRTGRRCGACDACLRACPTGALLSPGVVDPERCLSGLAARADDLPEEHRAAWGTRLYGCQTCQEVCPWNRSLDRETAAALGELGPSLPLRRVLSTPVAEIRGFFRGTQMGLSWVAPEAVLRNALLAAGNRRDPAVRPYVAPFLDHPHPLLRGTAGWALERIGG